MDELLGESVSGFLDFWPEARVDFAPFADRPHLQNGPRQKVRFDTVNYLNFNGNNGAIFSRVRPVIHFDVTKPEFAAMPQSADHYETTGYLTVTRSTSR